MTQQVLKDEYKRLHIIVCDGLRTWQDMAMALIQIRDDQLYKEGGYKTFEEYCKQEHEFTSSHARRLMTGCKIAIEFNLSNERQARTLSNIPETDRPEVMKRVRARQGKRVSSTMIQDMHQEVVDERPGAQVQDAPVLDIIDATVASAATTQLPTPDTPTALEIMRLIQKAGEAVKELSKTTTGAFINADSVTTDLRNAYQGINQTKPTNKCYSCQGRGCKLCKDTGRIPKAMHDRRPVEFR